jgi:hypothetical protein
VSALCLSAEKAHGMNHRAEKRNRTIASLAATMPFKTMGVSQDEAARFSGQ